MDVGAPNARGPYRDPFRRTIASIAAFGNRNWLLFFHLWPSLTPKEEPYGSVVPAPPLFTEEGTLCSTTVAASSVKTGDVSDFGISPPTVAAMFLTMVVYKFFVTTSLYPVSNFLEEL